MKTLEEIYDEVWNERCPPNTIPFTGISLREITLEAMKRFGAQCYKAAIADYLDLGRISYESYLQNLITLKQK